MSITSAWYALTDILGSQWFAKSALVLAIVVVAYFMLKPVKSASHLAMRRLLMMVFIAFAIVAILFPRILSWMAFALNIGRGTDLLLYGLTVVFFSSVVTAYRRDTVTERKLTRLARTIALSNVEHRDVDASPDHDTDRDSGRDDTAEEEQR